MIRVSGGSMGRLKPVFFSGGVHRFVEWDLLPLGSLFRGGFWVVLVLVWYLIAPELLGGFGVVMSVGWVLGILLLCKGMFFSGVVADGREAIGGFVD
jgi:hypothetical protein